jgi:hypothetical protein
MNSCETWYYVLRDLPSRVVKDITQLPLASPSVCSPTSTIFIKNNTLRILYYNVLMHNEYL